MFVFAFLLLLAPPDQTSILLRKGLLELQNGQLVEAREDLLEASRSNPQSGYVWSALAEVYLLNHEPILAASAAAQAEKYSANDPVLSHSLALYYSRAGDFAKAAAAESRFAANEGADGAVNARVAKWYLAANDIDSSLPFATKAAAADEQAAYELAQTLLKQQHFTEAAQVLEAGLATHKDDAQLTLALGVARYGQRRFLEAIERFLDVIRIDPTIEQPYRFLGRMLDQAGPHLDQIISDAQVWAEKSPVSGNAKLLLGKALIARNPDDPKAGDLLQRAVELMPGEWEAHYQLGTLLETKHQYEAAAEQLKLAVALNGNEPMPHYHLARVYSRLGKPDLAAEELKLHSKLTGGVK